MSENNIEKVNIHPGCYWSAIKTKPRCEKVVAAHCKQFNIPAYLPLIRKVKRYQRRTVITHIPMFSGYIFVELDQEERRRLLVRCSKLVNILTPSQANHDQLVQELQALQQLEAHQEDLEITVAPEIVPGQPVNIPTGPFQGMSGIVEKRKSDVRIIVNIEMLGQSACIECDIEDIELDLD